MTKRYQDLLLANKNMILNGAPGTGKTYLSKLIASQMIKSSIKSDTTMEENQFINDHIGFVQFHPSLDYTDFVEGLRPTKTNEYGNIGFELKNGVFKKFCANALINLIDSKKSTKDISFEKLLENKYNSLLDLIQNDNVDKIPLKTKDKYAEISGISDNNNILFKKVDGSSSSNCVSLNRLKLLAKKYKTKKELEHINNINQSIREIIGGCNSTWYWAVLSYIYDQFGDMSLENIYNEKIEEKKYVFIIDEINRGDISKIFGELFFAIDSGYRGKNGIIETQYQNLINIDDSTKAEDVFKNGFYIPQNVYIIGTMNDIDRSVESMDFAMRRRFAFIEITAKESAENMLGKEESYAALVKGMKNETELIEACMNANTDIINKMDSLNNTIISEEIGLTLDYQIGAAYFLKYALYANSKDAFEKLWQNHLQCVLKEYLRGIGEESKKLQILKNSYDNA